MEEDALKSEATSEVEDVMVPELGTRLLHLQQERARCLNYAAALSGWSMFWTVSLIAIGALVAAQGAFAKVWGNASWLTIAFIAFGVFTSAGTGFNSFFKPGERSPKFAEVGFEYERVERNIRREAAALYRTMEPDVPTQRVSFQEAMDGILRRADQQLDTVRRKELSFYVTGPMTIGRYRKAKSRNR
jgi:hypothetical protein